MEICHAASAHRPPAIVPGSGDRATAWRSSSSPLSPRISCSRSTRPMLPAISLPAAGGLSADAPVHTPWSRPRRTRSCRASGVRKVPQPPRSRSNESRHSHVRARDAALVSLRLRPAAITRHQQLTAEGTCHYEFTSKSSGHEHAGMAAGATTSGPHTHHHHASHAGSDDAGGSSSHTQPDAATRDPVCGMAVTAASEHRSAQGNTYLFCSTGCQIRRRSGAICQR